jgi:hypothetical protein
METSNLEETMLVCGGIFYKAFVGWEKERELLFGRRVAFTLVVLASQILLVALSITFFIELFMIAKNGSINVLERNWTILIIENVLSATITIFALVVLALQIKRLGERRKGDLEQKLGMTNRRPLSGDRRFK